MTLARTTKVLAKCAHLTATESHSAGTPMRQEEAALLSSQSSDSATGSWMADSTAAHWALLAERSAAGAAVKTAWPCCLA